MDDIVYKKQINQEGRRLSVNTMDVIMILVTLLCYILAFSKRVQKVVTGNTAIIKAEKDIAVFLTRHYRLLLLLVVFVATFVRMWKFGIIPYGFNQDEAMAALEALSLSKNGTDHYGMKYPVYFTAWISHQMNVLLSYILTPLFMLFGPSVFLARLPLLAFSLVSLYVVYRFSDRAFGKNAALTILFVVAINPWQIMISRWALEANLLPHLLLYGCYSIYLGLEKKRYAYFSMIFFGLAMYAYGIAYYLVPILLISLCVFMCLRKAVKWYDVVICFFTFMAIAWPIFTMMFINYFRLDSIELPFMTIPFFDKGERMNDILFFSEGKLKQLVENFLYVILFVFLQTKDRLWNSIPGIGPFYYVGIPLLILGVAFFVDELRSKASAQKDGIIVILMLFGASFISGLITNHVNLNRMNSIAYPVLFMIGYAVYQIVKRLKITLIPICLIFAILFGSFGHQYFYGDFSKMLGKEFYKGFVESVCYVKSLEYDKLYVTAKTQGDDAAFSSEILTQFLLEMDSEYTSGKMLPQGEEYTYEEKFIYGISPEDVDCTEAGTIFIIRNDERVYFDQSMYEFVEFEEYCVVIHRQNALGA